MRKKLLISAVLLGAGICANAQWTTETNIPALVAQEAAVGHPNGNIYVFSGYDAMENTKDSLYIFNQLTNTWSLGANMPNPLRAPAYCLGPDSLIYCFSGTNSNYVDSCYSYNPKTDSWKVLAPIPTPVWYSTAATANNGKIYVFGGENAEDSLQVYDPKTDTWGRGAPLPLGVLGAGAVKGPNGKIYLIGGMDPNAGFVVDSVQVYDPATDTWGRGTPMPTARHEFGYAADENGFIYCIGGKTDYGNFGEPFFNVVEIYDVWSDSWMTGTPLPHGLGELAAAFVNDGINVLGGVDSATVAPTSYNYRMLTLPNGISSLATDKFNVYPNPSTGLVNVQVVASASGSASVRLTNVMGETCFTQTWNGLKAGETKTLNLSNLAKGMYFMEYSNSNNKLTQKLILQ